VKIERLLLLLAALAVNGCRCGPGVTTSKPDFTALPTALNFNACPVLDENGMPVSGVFPDRQTVMVTNDGKVSGNLVLSLDNADAGFSIDMTSLPTSVGPSETVGVNVLFSPPSKGDAKGKLTIDDGDPDTMPVTVDLIGTGINLPAQPTVEAKIQRYDVDGGTLCNAGQPLSACEQVFPDTLIGDSVTQIITLRNTGCPAMKVTGIDLEMVAGGANDLAFFLDQPSQPPSAANPILMSQADGTNELQLVVRFSPHMDPSGDTQRFGAITVTTSDPNTPMLQLSLVGNGVAPAIYAAPTFCNFADMNDPCNATGPRVANQATFQITNGGTSPLTISSANFKSTGMSTTGSGGRFTVMTPIDGTTLQPAQSANLVVQHHDMPLFVIDTIVVQASPTSAGKITLTVEGGTEPCLATNPTDTLEFDDAGTVSTQTVAIKALATDPVSGRQCGTLIVNSVDIATNPFFSVVAPLIPAGTMIMPGSSQNVTVQYTKPVTGGRQAEDLIIKTNDPAFGDPAWKVVLLESSSPLNQIPVAVVKGCLNSDCMTNCSSTTMTVHLSTDFPGAKDVYICGGDSYDPGNPNPPGIATWQFVLGTHPGTATLDNNAMAITMNHTTLHLDPTVVGTYKVLLGVTDDTMQKSGTPAQLQINAYQ
jgi:hypothetical protein